MSIDDAARDLKPPSARGGSMPLKPEETIPDPEEKRVKFEEGTATRVAEGGAGRKIPPPEAG